jgi:hypothetical protein
MCSWFEDHSNVWAELAAKNGVWLRGEKPRKKKIYGIGSFKPTRCEARVGHPQVPLIRKPWLKMLKRKKIFGIGWSEPALTI